MSTIVFSADGTPAPQGSKTVARTRSGGSYVREDNPNTKPWRSLVMAAAREAMAERDPLTGPLLLEVTFRFPRPKSHYGTGRNAGSVKPAAPVWHASRPDLDKLLRALGDSLVGIVYVDDAQLVEVEAVKVYGSPGVTAIVSELRA